MHKVSFFISDTANRMRNPVRYFNAKQWFMYFFALNIQKWIKKSLMQLGKVRIKQNASMVVFKTRRMNNFHLFRRSVAMWTRKKNKNFWICGIRWNNRLNNLQCLCLKIMKELDKFRKAIFWRKKLKFRKKLFIKEILI